MPRIRKCRINGCKAPAFVPNHYCQKHIAHETEYRAERAKFEHRYQTKQSKESRCKYNHITRNRNETKAKQNKFYHSKEWLSMRKVVLSRDYYLCQYCKARGVIKEGNIVDHVLPVELYPQKMREIDNLVTCCSNCHYWKTWLEEQYYGTGLHGTPTDNPPLTDIKLISELSNKIKAKN